MAPTAEPTSTVTSVFPSAPRPTPHPETAVAVVGMSCRYPSAATPAELLRLQLTGKRGYGPRTPQPTNPLRHHPGFVPTSGPIDGIDAFDAAALGMTASAARDTDPQTLLMLELVREVMDHAGSVGEDSWGTTGVYVGAALPIFLFDTMADEFNPTGGSDPVRSLDLHARAVADYLPLRIAYEWDFTGPAVAVGATCATSLVAVHQGIQALLHDEVDAAIVGGVSLVDIGTSHDGYVAVPDGPFSLQGLTQSYGADADGTVFTQGAGVVALRRLSDAQRDGNPILGIIVGSAVTSDGSQGRASFHAPSVAGHAAAIEEALAVAGLQPDDIGLLHGHGTATVLGDDIEVQALAEVFGRQRPVPLTSIKAHIGHANSAAGIASLIATVQAAREKILPPSPVAHSPHPSITAGQGPTLLDTAVPWNAQVRWAGVSALGIGGVNCHVVVGADEQQMTSMTPLAAQHETVTPPAEYSSPIIALSAADETALQQLAHTVGEMLRAPGTSPGDVTSRACHPMSEPTTRASEVASMFAHHRRTFGQRWAVTPQEVMSYAADPEHAVTALPPLRAGLRPAAVWVFSGAGLTLRGAARDIYAEGAHAAASSPAAVFRASVDQMHARFADLAGIDCRSMLLTENIDPGPTGREDPLLLLCSLFVLQMACVDAAHAAGLTPQAVVGHSAGEYAAAVVAGVLQRDDACRLVVARGRAMAQAPVGAMLSIAATTAQLQQVFDAVATDDADLGGSVDVAAYNADAALVVSGTPAAIAAVSDACAAAGLPTRDVGIAAASHCRLIDGELEEFAATAATVRSQSARIPLISCVATAPEAGDTDDGPRVVVCHPGQTVPTDHWVRHIRQPVHFAVARATCAEVVHNAGFDGVVAFHVGPGRGVAGLFTHEPSSAAVVSMMPQRDTGASFATQLRVCAGALWAAGRDEWLGLLAQKQPYDVATSEAVPYPWQRTTAVRTRTERRGASETPQLQVPLWAPAPAGGTCAAPAQVWVWPPHQQPTVVPAENAIPFTSPAEAAGATEILVVDARDLGTQHNTARGVERVVDAVQWWRDLHEACARQRQTGSLPQTLLVVQHTSAVVTPGDPLDPVAAAVQAMVRVFAQEHAGMRWATLDLPPECSTVPAAVLQYIVGAGRPGMHYALRGGIVFQRLWADVSAAPELAAVLTPAFDDAQSRGSGVTSGSQRVVVLGGTGRVGTHIAVDLARRGHSVVVCSRSQPTHPYLLAALQDESLSLRWIAGDVTSQDDMAAVLTDGTGEDIACDAIIFAPAAVDLLTFDDMAAAGPAAQDEIHALVGAKVAGIDAVRQILDGARGRIPRVVVMASAATTVGGFGLAPYVAASAYLDAVCHGRAEWIALDWDRFRVGSTEETYAASEVSLRHAVAIDDACTLIAHLVDAPPLPSGVWQCAVSAAELNSRSRHLQLDRRGRLSQDIVASTDDDTAKFANDRQRQVARVWAEVLGRDDVDARTDFFAAGGHSLLATRVLALLEERYGLHARLRDFLDHPTVEQFCAQCFPVEVDMPSQEGSGDDSCLHDGQGDLSGIEGNRGVDEDPEGAVVPFPLTRIQHAYWVGRSDSYELGGVGCQFYLEYRARDLNIARYRAAWDATVARHPMLRAVVLDSGEQIVRPYAPMSLPIHDVRGHAVDEQQRLLQHHRHRVSTRVADPATGPVVHVEIVRTDAGDHVLIAVDVLMVDSASWMIVDRCVRAFYHDPHATPPPPVLTFAQVMRQQAELVDRRSAEIARAEAFWEPRIEGFPQAPAIATAPVQREDQRPRFRRLDARLSPAETEALKECAAVERVSLSTVLLSAYAQVLHEWSGMNDIAITVTQFDRSSLVSSEWTQAVEEVVGEFSSMLLVWARTIDEDNPRWVLPGLSASALQAMGAELFDVLEHRALSGVDIMTRLSRARGRIVHMPVVFTSMVDVDHGHDHAWLGDYVTGVSQTPQVWLDHQAFIHRHELVLQWDFAHVVEPAEAERFFERYVAMLRSVAAGTGTRLAVPAVESFTTASPAAAPVISAQETPTVAESAPAQHAQPGTAAETERIVIQVWADMLGISPAEITPDITLLAAGGDSLLAVRLANALRPRLGCVLPAQMMRADITVRDIVDMVHQSPPAAADMPGLNALGEVDASESQRAAWPLLPLQQAYLVGQTQTLALSYPTAHVYTDVPLWNMKETDPTRVQAALRAACDAVAGAHPMLRVQVTADGKQVFRPASRAVLDEAVQVLVVDLRDYSPEHVAEQLNAHRKRLSTVGPNPAAVGGATCIVGVILLPGGHGRFMVSSSLLVVDGWSAALLDRYLLHALTHPGQCASLALTFADYCDAALALESGQKQHHAQWWQSRFAELPAPPRLPRTQSAPWDPHRGIMDMLECRLSALQWEKVVAQARAHDVTPTVAVFTAFLVALAEVSQQRASLVTTLQHNRHPVHPDVVHMIGAFSHTALVSVDLGGAHPVGSPLTRSFAAIARDVAAASSECLQHNLVSAVELSRMLARELGTVQAIAPVVFQSTLGMDSALGGDLARDAGPLGTIDISEFYQQVRTPQVELELRVFELYGDCVLSLVAVPEVFGAVPEKILERVHDIVAGLACETGWSAVIALPTARPLLLEQLAPTPDHGVGAEGGVLPVASHCAQPWWVSAVDDAVTAEWSAHCGDDHAENFFELGGDSLTAIRMIQKILRHLHTLLRTEDDGAKSHMVVEMPAVADVLEGFVANPTAAGLRTTMLSLLGGASSTRVPRQWSEDTVAACADEACVQLRGGEGRPVFMIHPSGGDVLCYVDVSRKLTTERPVIALMDPMLAGVDVELRRVDDMVALYVQVVRHLQPEGPYTLGGWSMGGTLAHDMACALRREGHQVDLVWMIDSNSPDRIQDTLAMDGARPGTQDDDECMLLRHLRSMEAYLGVEGEVGHDPASQAGPGGEGVDDAAADVDALRHRLAECGVDTSVEAVSQRSAVFARHIRSLYAHNAQELDDSVPVLLFRADQISPRNSGEGMGVDDCDDPLLGWRPWVLGPLTSQGIAAHHYSIVRAPASDVVAAVLSERLADGDRTSTGVSAHPQPVVDEPP
nr:type I polyketide synthase [Corynebacterium sp. 13CS0277]